MNLVITVDTEADNEWRPERSRRLDNLRCLPRFHELCQRYGYRPTYLCTYDVATSPDAGLLAEWQRLGQAELGAHLHPWANPPLSPEEEPTAPPKRFPSELSQAELAAKLAALTAKLTELAGRPPRSFRAGRWGVSGAVIAELARLGYAVDSSVTPKVDWSAVVRDRATRSAPDFRRAPVTPYRPDAGDVCRAGGSSVTEVPMTILNVGWGAEGSAWGRWVDALPAGVPKRILNRLAVGQTWCRIFPETSPAQLDRLRRAASRAHLPHLVFMIHSSELLPHGSPYAKTAAAVERTLATFERFLASCQQHGLKPATLEECTLPAA